MNTPKVESVKIAKRNKREVRNSWLAELRNKGLKFRTFYSLDNNDYDTGRITVVSKYFPQTSTIHLQFSFCSVKNKFDRKEGQFIAATRLVDFPIDKKINGSIIEIIKEAIIEESIKKNISWMHGITKGDLR